jgi:hypothetical protein
MSYWNRCVYGQDFPLIVASVSLDANPALGNHLDHKDFFVGVGTGWIDYECARELGIDAMTQFQIITFGRPPIEK